MASNETINVLMLGAKRAGKSTLLASLVHSLTNGAYAGTLHASDQTAYAPGEETLAQKVAVLKGLAETSYGTEVSPDTGSTNQFREYRVDIDIPGYEGKTTLAFTDGNGEFVELNNSYVNDLRDKVSTHDIFLIAIDTPYLMEAANPDNRLCNEALCGRYNQVEAINNVLANIDDHEGTAPRQVIFVPIKCEKWLHEGRFGEVVERVKTVYEGALTSLSAYQNVEIGILPVQTVGNLEFSTHRKGYILATASGPQRCSWAGDEGASALLLATGGTVMPGEGESVNPDSRTVIGRMVFPYSWYRTLGRGYMPRNCDMLACHILRFALAKTSEAKKKEASSSSLGRLGKLVLTIGVMMVTPVWAWPALYILKRMGSINLDKLDEALKSIEAKSRQSVYADSMHIVKPCKLTQTNQ